MAQQSRALRVFLANLDELVNASNLMHLIWNMPQGINPKWQEKDRFFGLLKSVNSSTPFAALFLAGHAAFEEFLRMIFIECVVRINDAKLLREAVDRNHPNLLANNYYASGRALATCHEPIDYMAIDFDDVAGSLVTTIPGSSSQVKLNAAAFAFLCPAATVQSLIDSFGKLSRKLTSEQLGNSQQLMDILNTKRPGATALALDVQLSAWIRLRNRLAHSQGAVRDVDLTLVTNQHALQRAFAIHLDSLVIK